MDLSFSSPQISMWGRCCTRSNFLSKSQLCAELLFGAFDYVRMQHQTFHPSSVSRKLSLQTFGRLTPRSHRWYLKDATHLTGSEVWFIQEFPLPESWFVYDMEDVLISVSEATSPSTYLGDDIP